MNDTTRIEELLEYVNEHMLKESMALSVGLDICGDALVDIRRKIDGNLEGLTSDSPEGIRLQGFLDLIGWLQASTKTYGDLLDVNLEGDLEEYLSDDSQD